MSDLEPPKKQSRTRRKTTYKGASAKKTSGLVPRTDKQKDLIDALKTSRQVFILGPAGTGKTYVTATYASDLYTTKEIDKIVITRPHVAVGKELGFLKGDLTEKTMPWALPVLDVLEKHLGKGAVETGIKNGNIEMAPLALMRGRSFDNAFIIVDETQNISTHELKMLLTRVGEGTTIVLNGDVQQSDLKEADGLTKVIHLAKKHQLPVPIIEFGIEDIVRSDITAMWVKTFLKEGL
ncbi:PhoH-like phosphate starvation-inducible [Lentibacter phage vB_LenP_ICBM2]|uniref:PhoH-like protein n=1 Tax=Lentibacter phage vB_LenP_ICBM2 TaxID=2847823 RepID=A0A3G2YRV7_9CAUD|nr:PhoH-like phosphate starvation-inducible [Lentibacter phage vB_LenP_ICBM2]AYP28089.1 P-loop containing nucleoside triphosphate hydrolase [Lentibacter phage vB_LenP_ICBM2]